MLALQVTAILLFLDLAGLVTWPRTSTKEIPAWWAGEPSFFEKFGARQGEEGSESLPAIYHDGTSSYGVDANRESGDERHAGWKMGCAGV
jgi:hypothetical protein